MVLSFKPQFIAKIKSGTKIHTIRQDFTRRWEAGKKIHFAFGARTKNYTCFQTGICTGVQRIAILHNNGKKFPTIIIDGITRKDWDIANLILYDGFDSVDDFLKFFKHDFYGRIIHWTDFRY